MATFSGQFLGCKVSQTDLGELRRRLAADGFEERSAGGDVHVVNGCAGTAEAGAKTPQAIPRGPPPRGRPPGGGRGAGPPPRARPGGLPAPPAPPPPSP